MNSSHRHRKSFDVPGHAHELTFSCHKRYPFLSTDRPCQWLASAIELARVELDFAVSAYVFMPEHAHLIIKPNQPKYAMRHILTAIKQPVARRAVAYLRKHSAQWLPRIACTRGERIEYRFWLAGGGYDRNIHNIDTLRLMVSCTHNNPVRRGLVADPSHWKWSSAGWYGHRKEGPITIDTTLW